MATKRLAIYYGYPSLVNGSGGNVVAAVSVFKMYDQLILGAGLENVSHPDHSKTRSIIGELGMLNVQVFGYIDSTLAFKKRVDLWKEMGVEGIFCDKFGYDFGKTRAQQNSIVNYIHGVGLIAFVNAWIPADVFGSSVSAVHNPVGVGPAVGVDDWFLAQSYQIIDGDFQSASDWKIRSDVLAAYSSSFGTRIACVTTVDSSGVFDQGKMDYAYFSCVLYNFHSFGWGEYNFSAPTSLLPFRVRRSYWGDRFVGDIVENGGVFERQMNVGIRVLSSHGVDVVLG